jgi:hypothetical protein
MRTKIRSFTSQPAFVASFLTSLIVGFVCLSKIFKKLVSPWDELYHLAYVQYLYNFKIPQPGDEILSWSKYAFTCFPVHPFGFTTSLNCGAEGSAAAFPELGRNVASGWPPLYYTMSSIWMRFFSANDASSLFVARSFSAFAWSLGAGFFCYTLISRNRLPKEAAVSLSLLVAILPMGIFQSTFVTPNSMLLILVSIMYLSATSPNLISFKNLMQSILIFTLAILTIPHILPVIGFFTLRLLIHYWIGYKSKSKVLIFYIACTSLIPFAAFTLWAKFQGNRSIDVVTATQPISPFSWDQFSRYLFTFIPHSIDGYQFLNQWQFLISYVFSILLLALIFKPLVNSESPLKSKVDTLLLLALSCFFGVIEHFALAINIPPRYGLSLIFVTFLVITRDGISVPIERAFKSLALIGLVVALLSPVFGAST